MNAGCGLTYVSQACPARPRNDCGNANNQLGGKRQVTDNVVRVCAKAEIASDSVKAFEVNEKRLAVFNIGGRYYVTDDECTHASASLADGMLDGEVIECAMHMGAFHVPTGEVKAPPCEVALRTYKVVPNRDDVVVDLDYDAAGELA
jgi:nitrite reductase/ring-hydroxylating ferredoxin subunit